MNYSRIRREIEAELQQQEEQGQIQVLKDILQQEDIDLFY